MFPNFSYLAYYFFGTAPDNAFSIIATYGFFLALGVFITTVLFKYELRRKEKEGVFGYSVPTFETGYNGKFTSTFLNAHTLIAVISGVIGAKVFAVLEKLPLFFESPQKAIATAGMAAYGGLIFGTLASFLYFKKHKVPFSIILDTVSPMLFLSYAFARIGCQLSGDGCWGIVAGQKPSWWFLPDWMWQWEFPHNILQEGEIIEGCTFKYNHVLETPVFPTSFYEMVVNFALFYLMWSIRKKPFKIGLLFSFYLILNGIERFFIEFIRVNIKFSVLIFEFSQAQFIALFLIFTGIILCYIVSNRGKQIFQ